MTLSDIAVRRAKATGKPYTLPDAPGLSLAVSAKGGRSWHFRYHWLEEPKRMSLGTYPEVSLLEARRLRDQAQALVAKGVNPRVHRKQKRAAAKRAGEHTFEGEVLQALRERFVETFQKRLEGAVSDCAPDDGDAVQRLPLRSR